MSGKAMNLTLRIWRQDDAEDSGRFETHEAIDVSPDMSFLEMLDVVNEGIIADGNEPIAFDSDCREGICGTCSMVINGVPHGGQQGTTACQLHMRQFSDSDTITIEPWRATAFPVQRDLIVDRSSFDRIQQAGGFISVRTGSVPDANATQCLRRILTSRWMPPSASAAAPASQHAKTPARCYFVAAKVSHLSLVPQGQPGTRTPRPVHGATDG